jgi:putative hydrolase of the HAD superfamily
MAFKAIFLDAGGTLLSERLTRAQIYADAATRRGLPTDAASMRRHMYRVHGELPRMLDGHFRYSDAWFRAFIARIFVRDLGLAPGELPDLQDELFSRFADPRTFQLHAGALELCESLRSRGLRVGILSNWSAALPGILSGLGLSERVDFALVSAVEGTEKPEPEMFRRACVRAGVAPREALHAGNDPVQDVEGARAFGLDAVLVDHRAECTAATSPLVHSLGELERWITARLT